MHGLGWQVEDVGSIADASATARIPLTESEGLDHDGSGIADGTKVIWIVDSDGGLLSVSEFEGWILFQSAAGVHTGNPA